MRKQEKGLISEAEFDAWLQRNQGNQPAIPAMREPEKPVPVPARSGKWAADG